MWHTGGGLRVAFDAVRRLDVDVPRAQQIDQLRALEELKSLCAAIQSRQTVAFAGAEAQRLFVADVSESEVRRSTAAQVALARQESPQRGSAQVKFAATLVRDMPETLSALESGLLSEWRASLIVRETACLSESDRRRVDTELVGKLRGLGDRGVIDATRTIAYRLDPEAVVRRNTKAVADRCVTIRRAADCMAYVTAFLPMTQGVAVYAALDRFHATTVFGEGPVRSRGQVMADEFVDRILPAVAAAVSRVADETDETDAPQSESSVAVVSTEPRPDRRSAATDPVSVIRASAAAAFRKQEQRRSRTAAECDLAPDAAPATAAPASRHVTPLLPPAVPQGVDVVINLVMTDRTLLDGDCEPGYLVGYGPIPAPLARRIATAAKQTKVWIRRLFTDPGTDQLAAMDSHRRLFPATARDFLILRDQTCRQPWCGAPIRHADHIQRHADGGPTSIDNGQGLCEACNLTKETADWVSEACADGTVQTQTPTGHRYSSSPPSPPRSTPWRLPHHAVVTEEPSGIG